MELTQEELQAAIDSAVQAAITAHTAELRSEIQAQAEAQNSNEKAELLNSAVNEGAILYMDPGTGYEYALVHLDKIDYNPLSRRSEDELDPNSASIQALKADIVKAGGLTRKLLVYRKGDRYMLVKGARRLAALRALDEEITHAYILPAKPPIDMEERWVNGY